MLPNVTKIIQYIHTFKLKLKMQLKPFNKFKKKELEILNNKIFKFYSEGNYIPYNKITNHKKTLWKSIYKELREQLLTSKKKIKILEIGAAKTGFAHFLKEKKIYKHIDFYCFDITKNNQKWYQRINCKKSFYKDLDLINHKFDIVFSSYVLEHVVYMEKFLNKNINLLTENGKLYINCPRYDLPLYLNPGCRHINFLSKIKIALIQIFYRTITLIFKKNYFLITNDLSIFHKPYFSDADSMNWVSKFEISNFFDNKKFKTNFMQAKSYGKVLSKDWFIKKFCTILLVASKN